MNLAFVFSGQGAQQQGMGKDLYENCEVAREYFQKADEIREGTSRQCFHASKEELSRTENTQPCLHALNLASAFALQDAGITPDYLAGFSLGEFSALTFSGAMSFEQGMNIVTERGRLMQAASEACDSGMLAVLKLTAQQIEEICPKGIYPVNYNTEHQTVVAGKKTELASFSNIVKEHGGKTIALSVSGAFHSPLMQTASDLFAEYIEKQEFQVPQIKVISNMTSREYPEEIKTMVKRHMISPVRWVDTIQYMAGQGVDTFVELGPNATLSGMIKRIYPESKIYQVYDWDSLLKTVEALV